MTIVLAGTESGEMRWAPDATGSVDAAKAPPGGMPFSPDYCTSLTRKGHACTARPMKGTEACYGHSRGTDGR